MRLPNLIRHLLTAATLLRLLPITVVLLVGLGLSLWTHQLLSEHQSRVIHSYQVIDATKDLLIDLDDAETGERGYLIGGDRRFLQPYARALHRHADMTATLRMLVRDNPDQAARVDHLSRLMRAKLEELRSAIVARDQGGAAAAAATMLAGSDRATMDAIRHEIGQITHAELALLEARNGEVDRDERRAQLIALLIGLASILTRVGVEIVLGRRERAA